MGSLDGKFLKELHTMVAPQLIVVTHTSARSDVAGPVKDAHDALVVPSELAGHEMTAVRVSSSDGRESPPPWLVSSSAHGTNCHEMCTSYRSCLPRTSPRAVSGCGVPAPGNAAPAARGVPGMSR